MSIIEEILERNEDIKLVCPECGDINYGDSPTFCTTCGGEGGLGTIGLRYFLTEFVEYKK